MSLPTSGKFGTVLIASSLVAEITSWHIEKSSITVNYASNATNGFRRSIPGLKSASGTIEFKLDTFPGNRQGAAIKEGSTGSEMRLYIDTFHYYDIQQVTFKRMSVDCDINNGDVVGGTAEWEADGQYNDP